MLSNAPSRSLTLFTSELVTVMMPDVVSMPASSIRAALAVAASSGMGLIGPQQSARDIDGSAALVRTRTALLLPLPRCNAYSAGIETLRGFEMDVRATTAYFDRPEYRCRIPVAAR